MACNNEKEQLYLERETLGSGLGASLLQVRDFLWFQRNESPDIATLWPIAFMNESLKRYKNPLQ